MFGILLLSAVTLMHIYVFWRAGSVPALKRRVPRRTFIGAGLALWTVFYCGRVFGHEGTGALARALERFGMTWMGVLFLLFVCLLAMDFVTGFGLLLRRLAPSMRGLALVAGGVLSTIALIQGPRAPVVENFEVYLDGLPAEMDNTVLVALSDLHLGSRLDEQWLEARLSQVRAQRPDLIVLLGDLFEGHGQSQDKLLPVLRRFSAPLGVWAVPGNHDLHGRSSTTVSLIEEAGLQLLRNRWAEIRPGFVLAGVDDPTAQSEDQISLALAGRPSGATILLSHIPSQFEKAAKGGVDLMLCGHTHGGQIWPFGYLVKRVYPLLEGQHEVNGMTVIVCRGTGTWGPRMRLWSPGQILRVTLRSKTP